MHFCARILAVVAWFALVAPFGVVAGETGKVLPILLPKVERPRAKILPVPTLRMEKVEAKVLPIPRGVMPEMQTIPIPRAPVVFGPGKVLPPLLPRAVPVLGKIVPVVPLQVSCRIPHPQVKPHRIVQFDSSSVPVYRRLLIRVE